jgi:hypothetical protein
MTTQTLVVAIIGIASVAVIRTLLALLGRHVEAENDPARAAEACSPGVRHIHAHRGTGRQRHLLILDEPVPSFAPVEATPLRLPAPPATARTPRSRTA